jgi:hypothetical protein
MSNRIWQTTQTAVASLTDMLQQDVLADLAKTDPLLAKRLQNVNWQKVTDYVVQQSIEELAQKNGHEFVADKSELHGKKLSGEFLGAITVGSGKFLAWTRDKTGVHCTEQAHGYDDFQNLGSAPVRNLQAQFNEVYRKQAMCAVVQLLSSGQIRTEEREGVLYLNFEMEV